MVQITKFFNIETSARCRVLLTIYSRLVKLIKQNKLYLKQEQPYAYIGYTDTDNCSVGFMTILKTNC